MPKIISTSYQTNSFKIIKSTFSIYELPHAPVIFLINLGIFNCFENSDRAENFRQTVPIYGWWAHLNFRHWISDYYRSDIKFSHFKVDLGNYFNVTKLIKNSEKHRRHSNANPVSCNWGVSLDLCDIASDNIKAPGADLGYLKGGWLRKVFEKNPANKL